MSETKPETTPVVRWVARCHVCSAAYEKETDSNIRPTLSFCPECQESRRICPGVLNWQPIVAEVRPHGQ